MSDDKKLRECIIRLAYQKPELQEQLLPLVAESKVAHEKQAASGILRNLEQGVKRGNLKLKLDGKNMRLYESQDHNWGIYIIQVPVKPLKSKRVNVAVMYPSNLHRMPGENIFLPVNILQDAKISKSDTYESALRKLQQAMQKAEKDFEKGLEKADIKSDHSRGYPRISQEQANYLEVAPSDAKPFDASGKDFTVSLSWGQWVSTHYDEHNGPQSHDPSYTRYTSSSPTSARKLFKMLKAKPELLKGVSQHDFSKWLDQNKIKYKMNFSVWR